MNYWVIDGGIGEYVVSDQWLTIGWEDGNMDEWMKMWVVGEWVVADDSMEGCIKI